VVSEIGSLPEAFDKQNYVELYAAITGLEAFGALVY
jgi:hypothetical protein